MRHRLCAAVAVASLGWGATPLPASASTSGGVTALSASVGLQQLPCSGCGGSLGGTIALTLSGVADDGLPYAATWPDPTAPGLSNLSGGFAYTAYCPEPTDTVPPIETDATGSFTVAGGLLTHGMSVIHGAVLTGWFFWTTEGPAAVITFGGTQVFGAGGQLVAQSDALGPDLLDAHVTGTFTVLPPMTSCNFRFGVSALLDGTGFATL